MKTVSVSVVPRASRVRVEEAADGIKVHLTRPAQDNQANEQLIEVLADHWKIKKYRIEIFRGLSSRKKIIRIHESPPAARTS